MPATSPYLLLSFSIPADATDTKRAVTDALALHTSAWMVKYATAVVRVPTLTEVQVVIDRMYRHRGRLQSRFFLHRGSRSLQASALGARDTRGS